MDRPPPRAASRLPPSCFLNTSTVRVPRTLGECCTPTGQGLYRFVLACFPHTRVWGAWARQRPPEPPLPEDSPATPRSLHPVLTGTAGPSRVTSLAGGWMPGCPTRRRFRRIRPDWTDGRCTVRRHRQDEPDDTDGRIGFVRLSLLPGTRTPFEERHSRTATPGITARTAPSPFTPLPSPHPRKGGCRQGARPRGLLSVRKTRPRTRVAASYPESFPSMGFCLPSKARHPPLRARNPRCGNELLDSRNGFRAFSSSALDPTSR